MTLILALALAGVVAHTPQPSPPSRTQVVTGRVLDRDSGAPVAGVLVTLFSAAPAMEEPHRPLETTTDQDGRYTFAEVEPGRCVINVRKTGYAVPARPAVPPFDLAAGERHEVADLRLTRGGVIAGRVLDPGGQPMAGVRVFAFGSERVPAGWTGRQPPLVPSGAPAQTDDLGAFRVFGLAPGTYRVEATPEPSFGGAISPSPGTMIAATFYGNTVDASAAQAIPVGAGQTVAEIVIQMAVVPAFSVSGVVVDESGQPVAGAEVVLVRDPRAGASGTISFGPGNRTRSDAEGRFRIAGVASGAYTLGAAAPMVIPPSAGAPQALGRSMSGSFSSGPGGIGFVTIESAGGVTTEFRMDPAYQIAITVGDADVGDQKIVASRQSRRPD